MNMKSLRSTGVPRWIAVIAAIGAAFVLVPLIAMITRVNWGSFIALITSDSSVAALGLSLRTSLSATALCVVFGAILLVASTALATNGICQGGREMKIYIGGNQGRCVYV